MTWQQIAAEKKSHQLDSVPKEWLNSNLPSAETLSVIDFPQESNVLSALDLEITESSVASLLSNLASSKWSSVQVTTSFSPCVKTNCLTEIFVDRALARAKALDEHLEKTGKVVGALHGLPISIKDQVSIKGIESTMGNSRHAIFLFSSQTNAQATLAGSVNSRRRTPSWSISWSPLAPFHSLKPISRRRSWYDKYLRTDNLMNSS